MDDNSYHIRWKHFEIRPRVWYKDGKKFGEDFNFDLVKWSEDFSHCWSIAHINWDSHEPCYEIHSIGMRLMDDWEEGLQTFISAFINFQTEIMKLNN